jgi:hypothetical protein
MLMFTVTGYKDGISYTATIGATGNAGCAETDLAMAGWLLEQDGQPWEATPTGPTGITDLADPASVLGTLIAHTDVTSVEGDAPDLLGPVVPGTVY